MKFVITAGPTREPIDPVRFLSNRSSGKMGYAIAAAALEEYHHVVLISGPVALPVPLGAEIIRVTTGDEMFEAVSAQLADCDVLVMCAAVCDYKPVERAPQKMKKQSAPFSLALTPARDILASLTRPDRDCFIVGFAAETQEMEANAQRKMAEKKCDMMVANDVSSEEAGMDSDDNELTILYKNGEQKKLPRAKKKMAAKKRKR